MEKINNYLDMIRKNGRTVDIMASFYNVFAKILNDIFSLGTIDVANSKICQEFGMGLSILFLDFSQVAEKELNINIRLSSSPRKSLPIFSNTEKVTIAFDERNQTYIFSDRINSFYFHKERWHPAPALLPDLTQAKLCGQEIVIQDLPSYRRMICDYGFFDLVFLNGNLSCVHHPEKEILPINPSGTNNNFQNPDMIFRSYSFLSVPGETATLQLFEDDGEFWLKTLVHLEMGLTAIIYENILPLTDYHIHLEQIKKAA